MENFVIASYSRAEAILDGELVDVSLTAKEAGIIYPVCLSRAVFNRLEPRSEGNGQSLGGRVWDLLTMFRYAAKQNNGGELTFSLIVASSDEIDGNKPAEELITLKALCHGGDNLEPVITIMFPDED